MGKGRQGEKRERGVGERGKVEQAGGAGGRGAMSLERKERGGGNERATRRAFGVRQQGKGRGVDLAAKNIKCGWGIFSLRTVLMIFCCWPACMKMNESCRHTSLKAT